MSQPPGTLTDKTAPPVLRRRIFRLLVSTRAAVPLIVSNLFLSALFALMLWGEMPRRGLAVWLSLAFALSLIDLAVRLRLSASQDTTAARRTLRVLDALVGLTWLYAAAAFFPATGALQFFYLFALGAAALSTAVYQHYDLPASMTRIGLAMPVAAFHFLSVEAPFREAQSLLILGIWASIAWLGARLHRALEHRVLLTLNRDALLEKVADGARELDELRTAEANSREQAELANLAKSRFLAHSSHDLRQPLHAISLLLETVDDERLDAQTGHVIGRVRQSIEMLAQLFDSLLDVTLLDTGQVEIVPRVFDLDRVLGEIAADFDTLADANDVRIHVEASGLALRADPTVTRRMIQNLAANAIRHAPGGRVTLRGRLDQGALIVEVEDTGSGIATEDQQRIFEEFTKLEADGGGSGGLGLGLAIVNRLARLTGITVGVRSELDRGSLFYLGPFEVCASDERPAEQPVTPKLDLIGTRIAVVDDDRDTLRATGKLLNKWGLTVSLHEIAPGDDLPCPDILVCDYELGGETTGLDVIRRIRTRHGKRVPALLISGNTSAELAARAQSEALPLLHKPVRPVQLKSAILTLLGSTAK